MQCLWLTVTDPDPRHNGQMLYSGGLIDAMADVGVEVDVLCLTRSEARRRSGMQEGRVRWWVADDHPLSRWASLVSPLPNIARRTRTPAMERMLVDLLGRKDWDSIVLDSISLGWALAPVLRRYPDPARRPKLIYVSHNHEESTRAQIAANHQTPLKRQVLWLDACKASRLERDVVDAVDIVTAITGEDCRLYRQRRPDKPVEVLPPGYCGRRIADRRITASLPLRAIVVGSFDWVAKRMNLEEFVSVADPIFAAAGAELQVIGSAEQSFLDRLRRRTKATTFTGPVESVTSYMDQARLAIVPERTGGGFKLKVLDYVFNRTPILALSGSVAGVPLRDTESILLYPDHETLARGVLRVIDDLDLLNRLQDSAYAACSEKFDWASRGRQLLSAIAA
jgi:glycosyltransferase involved in cell wall biosynthesis